MGVDYFVFYTEASAVCILILLMILINDRLYRTQQEKQIWFSRAVVSFILYFVSDACWAAMLSGQFPRVRIFVELFNFSNYFLLSLMAYGLFMFIAASEKMPFRNSKNKRLLCFLPVMVTTLVMLILYRSDPLFWINENNELNDLYYPLMIATPSVYLLASFVFSVINSRKSDIKEERRLYLLIGSIPIGVMAFGMIQVVGLNAPTFCFGCTIMWLWFYLQNLQTMISVDDLTHLNNRRQINRYMEQIRFDEDAPTYFMMIDVNRFKTINDTYGHAEGDKALVFVADSLRQACEHIRASAFIGRYGGDEFVIIIQDPEEGEHPEQIVETLRTFLTEKQRENRLPYDLGIGIGYEELRDKNDTPAACLIRADEKLYIDKKKNGMGR